MSPVSPPATLPGVWLKTSQMDAPRPSARTAPSIWYAAVAAPHRNGAGASTRTLSILAAGVAVAQSHDDGHAPDERHQGEPQREGRARQGDDQQRREHDRQVEPDTAEALHHQRSAAAMEGHVGIVAVGTVQLRAHLLHVL